MFHYNNKNRRVNLKICILHLINYHTSSVLEQNVPQVAATWRWCSRCCSPSPPPSTAPLTPATVLPAEGTPLASSDRRAAPGGCCYLPLPPLATHPAALGITTCSNEPAHKQAWFASQSSPGVKPGLLQHVREVGGLMSPELRAVLKALGELAQGGVDPACA